MPNIASVFKDEIARVARKEIRAEVATLKKASTNYRAEIASLKRRLQATEQDLKRLGRANARPAAQREPNDASQAKHRFSAKGLASQRQRLGLSADALGLLVGTTGQSVYNWESGSARPRDKHLAAIASLRTMGKKEAVARLEQLRAA